MGLQLSGSVQLEGNLLVTGSANSVFENVLVSGTLVAQEINTQFVSASIIFSSGSNKFGDESGDKHQFTGSVDVSGSLSVIGTLGATTLVKTGGSSTQFLKADGSVDTNTYALNSALSNYLLLSGGTLTGALNGTSAVFTSNSGIIVGAGGRAFIRQTAGGDAEIGAPLNGTLSLFSNGSSVLNFLGTGAATFSSSVTSDGLFKSNQGVFQIFVAGLFRGGLYNYASASGSGTDYSTTLLSETNLYFTINGSATRAMTLNTSGRLLLGTTDDNGARLQVSGSATFSSGVGVQSGNSLFVNNANNTRSGFLRTSGEGTELSSFAGAGEPLILIAPDTSATIRFYTGGSTGANERMRITSAGNVGIGTDTPDNKLAVWGSNNGLDSSQGNINVYTTDASAINTGGSIGLGGYYNTSNAFIPFANITGKKENSTNDNAAGYLAFLTRNNSTGTGERMRITSEGKVIIGASYMTYPVSIEAQTGGGSLALTRNGAVAEFYLGGSTGGTTQLFVRSGGSGGVRLDAGSTGWVADSDIRLKNIEKPIENAVESLSTLQTIYYSWKDLENKKQHIGLIAQEVEEVFPEIVSESSMTEMKGVNYMELIPVLVAAIKELKIEIEELKSKIETLENI